ncbi:MAG TPA: hypothetical protein IAB13_08510 [Candidatus Avanaerovorax faecigallinarum]|nr:hypothetical protein [Candidatus Avanaerovorax faecigallinarum]
MKKTTSALMGTIFLVILMAVFIANIIIPDKKNSDEENRVLQQLPSFSVSAYKEGRFESKIEDYASDQFMLRNGFIRLKTAADTALGGLESNGVYRCRDSYLMEDITVPTKDVKESNTSALTAFKEANPDLKMYFLLAPNAANILSDKLPVAVSTANQNKYMDDFFETVESLGITPIDVRDTFKEAKKDTQLYYRTDHHWTTDGAYLAFEQVNSVMDLKNKVTYTDYAVKNDFRGTLASKSGFVNGMDDAIKIYLPAEDSEGYENSVIYYSDTKEKTTQFYQVDSLDTKDAYTVFGGSNHPMYTVRTPLDTDRHLLLIKDSYANSMVPFLSQCFSEIVVVDPRYFYDNIQDIISSESITDVLFLYNANTFFADMSLEMMVE